MSYATLNPGNGDSILGLTCVPPRDDNKLIFSILS